MLHDASTEQSISMGGPLRQLPVCDDVQDVSTQHFATNVIYWSGLPIYLSTIWRSKFVCQKMRLPTGQADKFIWVEFLLVPDNRTIIRPVYQIQDGHPKIVKILYHSRQMSAVSIKDDVWTFQHFPQGYIQKEQKISWKLAVLLSAPTAMSQWNTVIARDSDCEWLIHSNITGDALQNTYRKQKMALGMAVLTAQSINDNDESVYCRQHNRTYIQYKSTLRGSLRKMDGQMDRWTAP